MPKDIQVIFPPENTSFYELNNQPAFDRTILSIHLFVPDGVKVRFLDKKTFYSEKKEETKKVKDAPRVQSFVLQDNVTDSESNWRTKATNEKDKEKSLKFDLISDFYFKIYQDPQASAKVEYFKFILPKANHKIGQFSFKIQKGIPDDIFGMEELQNLVEYNPAGSK
jgi:hypothetical protein